MITIRKLKTLRRATAVRKIAHLLRSFEEVAHAVAHAVAREAAGSPNGTHRYISNEDREYIMALLEILLSGDDFDARVRLVIEQQRSLLRCIAIGSGVGEIRGQTGDSILRICNAVRHAILQTIGAGPGDWDLYERHPYVKSVHNPVHVESIQVFLDDLRSPYNVGSIFRTAESFSVERILLTDSCPSPDHPRAKRAAMGCVDIIPWQRAQLSDITKTETLFALEVGGPDIYGFPFPKAGTVILGNEELGISPAAMSLARQNGMGLVSIPTYGTKGSLNVASAFAILLYAWHTSFELKG